MRSVRLAVGLRSAAASTSASLASQGFGLRRGLASKTSSIVSKSVVGGGDVVSQVESVLNTVRGVKRDRNSGLGVKALKRNAVLEELVKIAVEADLPRKSGERDYLASAPVAASRSYDCYFEGDFRSGEPAAGAADAGSYGWSIVDRATKKCVAMGWGPVLKTPAPRLSDRVCEYHALIELMNAMQLLRVRAAATAQKAEPVRFALKGSADAVIKGLVGKFAVMNPENVLLAKLSAKMWANLGGREAYNDVQLVSKRSNALAGHLSALALSDKRAFAIQVKDLPVEECKAVAESCLKSPEAFTPLPELSRLKRAAEPAPPPAAPAAPVRAVVPPTPTAPAASGFQFSAPVFQASPDLSEGIPGLIMEDDQDEAAVALQYRRRLLQHVGATALA